VKAIIGLGNPGKEYAATRHSVGFVVVDKLADMLGTPAFGFEPKFKSEVIGTRVTDSSGKVEAVLLVKPQTFMNDSGEAVGLLANFYKDRLTVKDLWVIHDDVDLELGRIKIQKGGSTAGHHGLESIAAIIGSDFVRFRFGIGRPEKNPRDVYDFVLGKFTADELGIIGQRTAVLATLIKSSLENGLADSATRGHEI
jgi:PTH1 family peptidyl-tRNA hydrolase